MKRKTYRQRSLGSLAVTTICIVGAIMLGALGILAFLRVYGPHPQDPTVPYVKFLNNTPGTMTVRRVNGPTSAVLNIKANEAKTIQSGDSFVGKINYTGDSSHEDGATISVEVIDMNGVVKGGIEIHASFLRCCGGVVCLSSATFPAFVVKSTYDPTASCAL